MTRTGKRITALAILLALLLGALVGWRFLRTKQRQAALVRAEELYTAGDYTAAGRVRLPRDRGAGERLR